MTKKNFTEIESIIEDRIAELSEDYELDRWDIADIRLAAYRENGWDYDPFPEEDEDEEEDEEAWRSWTLEDQMRDVGMSWRDFL